MKKRKKDPLVSICIPNYNYEATIAETIESALNQTYSNIEIIVLDNCSTDNSYQVAKKYRKQGVKVFRNRYNLGVQSHNKVIEMSSGEFVHVLHSDDMIEPTFIEKCMKVMQKYPNVGVVVGERIEINERSESVSEPLFFYNTSCVIPAAKQRAVLVMASYYVPSQTFMRRSVLEQVGLYEIDITYFMDWWLLYKLCLISDFAVINEPLMKYRIWQSSDSSYMTKHMIMPLAGFLNRMSMIDNAYATGDIGIIEREEMAVTKQADLTLKLGVSVIRNGLYDVGDKYLYLAKAYDPEIINNSLFQAIEEFLQMENKNEMKIDLFLEKKGLAGARTKSYDPPEGFIPLSV